MLALRDKNVVTDDNILYLECECGCNILVFEYYDDDKSLGIRWHDQSAVKTYNGCDYLWFEQTAAEKVLQAIVDCYESLIAKYYIIPDDLDTKDEEGTTYQNYLAIDTYQAIQGELHKSEGIAVCCYGDAEVARKATTDLSTLDLDHPENNTPWPGYWGIVTNETQSKILVDYARGVLNKIHESDGQNQHI